MKTPPKTIKVEEKEMLKGRDALKDIFTRLGIKLGKREQRQSLFVNPRSKHFNKIIAVRRAKEKARRRFNAAMA